MTDRFIQTQKLYQVVDFEAYLFILILGLSAYLFYKFLLKGVSLERHLNIQNQLKSLMRIFIVFSFLFAVYWVSIESDFYATKALLPYFGLITFVLGAFCFVRTCHLLVLQYLFLGSMRAGVPLLIVNIFSLILSIVIAFWTVGNLFGVQLTPLLATSAAFSIILGLALQDTLGNLFAGISLQMDKTFEIGNWIEVMNGSNKIVGQVKELSWRATVLVGFSDELITIPNKLISSCQISNFSPENNPIIRSQTFKFPHGTNTSNAIETLEQAATQISEVKAQPAPSAFVLEANENSINIKLIYFIDNYGRQFAVGDKVVNTALSLLAKNNLELAKPTIEVYNSASKL